MYTEVVSIVYICHLWLKIVIRCESICLTNCQILRYVKSTFVFEVHNFEILPTFRGTQQSLPVECNFVNASTAPNGPSPHHWQATERQHMANCAEQKFQFTFSIGSPNYVVVTDF